jgi:hypothetical protein
MQGPLPFSVPSLLCRNVGAIHSSPVAQNRDEGTKALSGRLEKIHGTKSRQMEGLMRNVDRKDRLILALAALLRAERETRGALEAALQNESVKIETLRAILADPVPVITEDDILVAEEFAQSRQLPPFHFRGRRPETPKRSTPS